METNKRKQKKFLRMNKKDLRLKKKDWQYLLLAGIPGALLGFVISRYTDFSLLF